MHQSYMEIPLIAAEWQLLLDQDAIRAQRRYLYHVVLSTTPNSPFRSSIGAFQQIAKRTPYHFLRRASKQLPQLLSSPIAEVWQTLTTHPYKHHNPYLQFIGPGVILQRIVQNIQLLNTQAQQSGLTLFATHTQTTRASLKQMINRLVENPSPEQRANRTVHAHIRASWQLEVATLAIVLEELALEKYPLVVQATDFQSTLEPYPDEQEWYSLLNTKPHIAQQQYLGLLDARTHNREHIPFNLGESIAAFQAISETH